jgi:anthranilate phosphoribosyltransferase
LANPAGAKRQLIGVFDKETQKKIAVALVLLGTEKALVVNSDIDEISVSSETDVIEVSGSSKKEYRIAPEDFGFKRSSLENIRVGNKAESAETILGVLKGNSGTARDIVLLNAGAAIFTSGIAGSIKEGISLAEKSIDSGSAMEKLEKLKNFGKGDFS